MIDAARSAPKLIRRVGAVEAVAILAGAAAMVMMVVVVVLLLRLSDSRYLAARDSCYLLRGLVHASTTKAPAQRRAAQAYIARTQLADCDLYARSVIR